MQSATDKQPREKSAKLQRIFFPLNMRMTRHQQVNPLLLQSGDTFYIIHYYHGSQQRESPKTANMLVQRMKSIAGLNEFRFAYWVFPVIVPIWF